MALNSFSQHFDPSMSLSGYEQQASVKSVVFCWGRFQPPTRGHKLIFDEAYNLAKKQSARLLIFASQTQDDNENPLDYSSKIKYLRRLFPNYAINIVKDESIKTIFDVMVSLYNKGYRKATMIAGSDRVHDFSKQINNYNGKRSSSSPERYYNFLGGVKVLQAGESRDSESSELKGISGKKARKAARSGNFELFSKYIPHVDTQITQELYSQLRSAYGLSEEIKQEDHRDFFFEEYKQGTKVLYKQKICKVIDKKSNYLIIEDSNKKIKVWPKEVIRIN